MANLDSLIVNNTKYTFHTPQIKVSSNEAREECQLQQMQLANIEGGDKFAHIARHIIMYHNIYDIWHVGIGDDKNGFVFLNMNRKFINKFAENSNKLKVIERQGGVALYTFANKDFDSKKIGSYICMSQVQNMEFSSTESYNYHDETKLYTNYIILGIFSYIYDKIDNNATTDLNLHQTNNSTGVLSKFNRYRHQFLGIFVGIMLFVVVLVFAILYFVLRKRKNRNNS